MLFECNISIYCICDRYDTYIYMDYKGVIFMNLLLNIVIAVFVGLIIDYSYNNLRNENKILRKDIDELQYKLLTYENGGIFEVYPLCQDNK